MSNLLLWPIIWGLCALGVVACQSEVQIDGIGGLAGGEPQAGRDVNAADAAPTPEGLDPSKKTKKDKKSSDPGNDDEDGEDEEGDGEISFPNYNIAAVGTATDMGGSKNSPINLALEISVDEDKLEFRSIRGSVRYWDSDHQDEATAKFQRHMLGLEVFKRTSKADIKAKGLEKKEGYLVFADSVVNKKGVTFTFDQPLPVYPFPAAKSRYRDVQAETFTAKVTVSSPIASHFTMAQQEDDAAERIFQSALQTKDISLQTGRLVESFQVEVKVAKQAGDDDDEVVLVLEMTIDAEENRRNEVRGIVYEQFPMQRRVQYHIDTQVPIVRKAMTRGESCGDRSGDRETSTIEMSVCEKEQNGNVETFSCPAI